MDFTTSVTTSTWPSNQYWFIVAKDLGSTLEEEDIMKPSSQKVKSQIQEDYTKVDVYFQTLNVKAIVQSPVVPDEALISNLGGAFSLYLGVALIMAFEVVEFLWDVATAIMQYLAVSGLPSKAKKSKSP